MAVHFESTSKLKITLIFSFSFGLTLLISIYFYNKSAVSELNTADKMVEHTHKVLETTGKLVNAVTSAESASRAFATTGNAVFLENFKIKQTEVLSTYQSLAELTSDNQTQNILIDTLSHFIGEKLKIGERLILLKTEDKTSEVFHQINSLQGKLLMDSINLYINEMIAIETDLLSKRQTASQNQLNTVGIITEVGTILSLIITIGSLIFIFIELSHREKLQKKLAHDEKLLNQFLDTIPVGVLILKNDGQPQFCNKKIVEYFPLLEKSHSAKSISKNLHTLTDLDSVSYNVETIIHDGLIGKSTRLIGIHAESDQSVFLNLITEPVRNDQQQIEFLIFVFSDTTMTELAKKELLKAKNLAEESVRIKENFLANMSHEIRTPLNAIIGFANLLVHSDLKKEESEYVRAINYASTTLLYIINDILDFSKIEAGMINVEQIPFNLPGTLESFKQMLEYKAKEKGIDYIFNIDKNLPKVVVSDSVRLTQILTNLVGNAIKFTDSGKVQVDVKCLNAENNSARIRFTVSDTGIGIPKEKQHLIFSRFNQAGDDINRRFGGTGLGLNITQSLTTLLGGQISFESEVGKGSVFTLDFKFTVAEDHQLFKSTISGFKKFENSASSHYSILLVDDNELNRKLARTILNNLGFSVTCAENGKAAVEYLTTNHFDIVLLDLQMPVMNGYETIDHIRNILKSDIPVIAMTAHSLSSERTKCLTAGMNDYIIKPFVLDDLYNKISMQLQKNTPEAPVNSAPVSQPDFDFSYLENLTSGDNDMMLELMELFVTNTPTEIRNLQNAVQEKNKAETENISHKIRSSFNIIGLASIAEELLKIETLEKNEESWNTISNKLRNIKPEIDSAFKNVTEKINSLKKS